MKICFVLITFYERFECCQNGLPCFTVFRVVEKEMIYRFNTISPPQIQVEFIVLFKPCLNLCSLRWPKLRRNLVNIFIPYGL